MIIVSRDAQALRSGALFRQTSSKAFEMSESKGRGWFYIVCGIVFLSVGLLSLFDPNSNRIRLGAIVLGPIFVIRGIWYIRRDDTADTKELLSLIAVSQQVQKEFDAVREAGPQIGNEPKRLSCENCGKDYYRGLSSRGQFGETHHSVAPCPACGHIQKSMFADTRGGMPESASLVATLLAILALGCFAIGVNVEENSRYYYYGALGILLFGIGFYCWKRWQWYTYNPNTEPLELRMKMAQQNSIGLTEWAAMSGTRAQS